MLTLLTSSLRFITQGNINISEVRNITLKYLWKHTDNLDVKLASYLLINTFCISDLSPIAFLILHNMQRILIINATELYIQQIIEMLNRLEFVVVNNKEH